MPRKKKAKKESKENGDEDKNNDEIQPHKRKAKKESKVNQNDNETHEETASVTGEDKKKVNEEEKLNEKEKYKKKEKKKEEIKFKVKEMEKKKEKKKESKKKTKESSKERNKRERTDQKEEENIEDEKEENGKYKNEKELVEVTTRKSDSHIIDIPETDDIRMKNRRASLKRLETFCSKLFARVIQSKIPITQILTYILVGYIIGLIITILWYNFITIHKVNIHRWGFYSAIIIICLILAHGSDIRCTVAVAIPILTTSQGRSLIMAVAFFLSVIGPTANTFKNINVMGSSLVCGQMQLKQVLSDLVDAVKKPLVTIKEAVKTAIRSMKKVLKIVEKVLLFITRLIMTLLTGIKAAFSWLRNTVSICNKEFGTPFERCIRIADNAIEDCRKKLGSFSDLCELTNVFRWLCYTAKVVDVICVLVDFISDAIIGAIIRKLQAFIKEVKKIFDVSITFDHDFYFKTTTSRDLDEIRDNIMNDIKNRLHKFLFLFSWLDTLNFSIFGFVCVKAIYFRMKYIRNPNYHNTYITPEFLEIDERRKVQGQETALPLRYYESLKYPRLSGYMLTSTEWLQIATSAAFLQISTMQLLFICLADYCLFWVLALISFFGHRQKGFEPPPYITVHVSGKGFVGEIFRSIVGAFEPLSQNYTLDMKHCLPLPSEPNFKYYYYILVLCLLAWLFVICEPYCLRLRHVVMRHYYPDVAKDRAVWLYNKILLNRTIFMKSARRKARLLSIKDQKTDDFSFIDWMIAKAENNYVGWLIWGRSKTEKCILCYIPLKSDNRVECETVGCKALYCKTCYAENKNVCCICNNPSAYGDLSDESNVKDSSDEPDVVHIDEHDEYCSLGTPSTVSRKHVHF